MVMTALSLTRSLAAWDSESFVSVFKSELENVSIDALPLQQGMTRSSHVSGTDFTVMVNHVSAGTTHIVVRAGVFYKGIIAGCSCADDPTPIDEINEYCELEVVIDRTDASATVKLL